jgi:hypothetical protein
MTLFGEKRIEVVPEKMGDSAWRLVDSATDEMCAEAYRYGDDWHASLNPAFCAGQISFLPVVGKSPEAALLDVIAINIATLESSLADLRKLDDDVEPSFDEPIETVECEAVSKAELEHMVILGEVA